MHDGYQKLGERMGSRCLMDIEFPHGKMIQVLRWMVVMRFTLVAVYLMPLRFKVIKTASLTLYESYYHFKNLNVKIQSVLFLLECMFLIS